MAHPGDLPTRAAALLLGGSPVRAVLELVVADLALRSVRLCAPGPTVLDVAGDVLDAVPAMRAAAAAPAVDERVLPLPGGPLTLVVVGAAPADLDALRSVAALLALALVRSAEVSGLLREADEDADALADALHDGPVQALVAARYACDAVVRGADPGTARDAVQDALVALRRTLAALRPRGAEGLAAALDGLSARRAEAGGAPLHLDLQGPAPLGAEAAGLVHRVVQAAAAGPGAVRVVVDAADRETTVEVSCPALPDPARWRSRVAALGGSLTRDAGVLHLRLPVPGASRRAAPTAVHRSAPTDPKVLP